MTDKEKLLKAIEIVKNNWYYSNNYFILKVHKENETKYGKSKDLLCESCINNYYYNKIICDYCKREKDKTANNED